MNYDIFMVVLNMMEHSTLGFSSSVYHIIDRPVQIEYQYGKGSSLTPSCEKQCTHSSICKYRKHDRLK